MNSSQSSLAPHRYRRIEESPAAVLPGLCHSSPLYLHVRNWMAEMSFVSPLTESFTDESAAWLGFPEQGLNLSLRSILFLHSIAIGHPTRPSMVLEVATHGEPRAVSIAAIPLVSNLDALTAKLDAHPSAPLSAEQYDQWRARHLILPKICPCCAGAAEKRRLHPEAGPLARILTSAVLERRVLHCQLSSPAFSATLALRPGEVLYPKGNICLTGNDQSAMVEIDPGLCHSFELERRTVDAEPMTFMRVFNSFGIAELTIGTPGFEVYDPWVALCR